jgi:hypothetical protein
MERLERDLLELDGASIETLSEEGGGRRGLVDCRRAAFQGEHERDETDLPEHGGILMETPSGTLPESRQKLP